MMPTTILSPRGRLMIYCLIIVAGVFAIYGGNVDHPFQIFDDTVYVSDNYYVQNGLTLEGCGWAFRSLEGANWHPLTWLSHMLDVEVFGPKPAGHYMTNLLLHALAALLLFRLIYVVCRNEGMAFAVALLWAVHPANVECVAWIAERKTLLATVLMLAGMTSYYQYRRTGARRYYLLCIVAHILASMAKPIAVLFPIALVLLDELDAEAGSRLFQTGFRSIDFRALADLLKTRVKSLKDKIPFILIAGYLSILTFFAQDTVGATDYTYQSSIGVRCERALESIFAYLVKSFSMPESSLLYVLRPVDGLWAFYGALLVILIGLAILAFYRRRRIVAVGLSWYLLMFLPTIGLVQVGSQRMADRYLGWPLIGLLCVICYGGAIVLRQVGSWVLPVVAVGAWALGLGMQSRALCVDWEDDLRLSQNAYLVGGGSSSMLLNSSVVAAQRGDLKSARQYLMNMANEPRAQLDLAYLDLAEKKYDDTILRVRRLFSDKSTRLGAAAMAGMALDALGRPRDSRRAFLAAISFLPPERTYLLHVERLRATLPLALANATAKEIEAAANEDHARRWPARKRMEPSR